VALTCCVLATVSVSFLACPPSFLSASMSAMDAGLPFNSLSRPALSLNRDAHRLAGTRHIHPVLEGIWNPFPRGA